MDQKIKNDQSIIQRFASKGIFPHQFAFTLLIPLRNIFLSPQKLIERLELKSDFIVLEIGPGPGYFSRQISKFLTNGKLVLADIQQEMLDIAKRRILKKGLTNVDFYLCDGKTFDFPSESFDVVFMVTVIGEVENKKDYLLEIRRILKQNGVLSITELAGDPDKISIEELTELVSQFGFTIKNKFGSPKNYTVNFSKIQLGH